MDYNQIVREYYDEAISKLKEWIQIDSVYDQQTVTVEHPFGEGVHQALEFIASLAEKKGFEVDRCDGYCTEIAYGTGPKLIGIFAHADVVPVSGEWKHAPFGGEIVDDTMFGRGTSDDKGPAMAAFYALCALKDAGLIRGYRVTLVIGGNEESGSACLEHYYNVMLKKYPDYGFTPDGEFPLIYGEKGIVNYKVTGVSDLYPILRLHGGVVANSVIDKAEAILVRDDSIEEDLAKTNYDYVVEHDDNNTFVKFFGKAAHGSTPQLGVNAGLQLLDFLGQKYDFEELKQLAYAYKDPSGKNMDEKYSSKELHETTYNVGLINYDNMKFEMVVNFRYPENVQVHPLITRIDSKTPFKSEIIGEPSAPLLFDPECKMVKALEEVYIKETGDTVNKKMTIGGGTYAKETRNTIAVGSAFPGVDCRIHNSDEFILLEHFRKSMAIYAHAIMALGIEI